MRNDLKLLPWEICSEADGWNDEFLESVFFLGNGRMGVRGYLPLNRICVRRSRDCFLREFSGKSRMGLRTL